MTEEAISLEQRRRMRRGSGNDGGNGRSIEERLAGLEAHMDHVATRADIQALKNDLLEALDTKLSQMPTKEGMESNIKSVKLWVLAGTILAFIVAAGFGIGIAEVVITPDTN